MQIYPEFELVDAQEVKPVNQDIMCLIFHSLEDGSIYPNDKLHFWNGFAWWPCDGDYYEDEKEGIRWHNINPEDVVYFVPIYPCP